MAKSKGPVAAQADQIIAEDDKVLVVENPFKAEFEIAEKEWNDAVEEQKSRKYLVNLKKDDIKLLDGYIQNQAPWSGANAFGIVELSKITKDAVSKGKLFIDAIAIEAVLHFLNKVEGAGVKSTNSDYTAETLKAAIIEVLAAKESIKTDADKLAQLEYIASSYAQGVDPNAPEKTLLD